MKKNCYCSGYTRKDGSKILCMICQQKIVVEKYKSEIKPISVAGIKKNYLEDIAYEDYDPSENDGYIDHEAISCRLCSMSYETEREAVKHFQKEHNT